MRFRETWVDDEHTRRRVGYRDFIKYNGHMYVGYLTGFCKVVILNDQSPRHTLKRFSSLMSCLRSPCYHMPPFCNHLPTTSYTYKLFYNTFTGYSLA